MLAMYNNITYNHEIVIKLTNMFPMLVSECSSLSFRNNNIVLFLFRDRNAKNKDKKIILDFGPVY